MASNRLWRNPNKKIVIIDSNAILTLFEYSINLDEELTRLIGAYKIVVPTPIFKEITNLSKYGRGKKKVNAKSALKLIKNYQKVNITTKSPDEAVIKLAKKLNGIVFSNDKEIRKIARKEKLKNIFLRAKNCLDLNEPIL
jgi:rRNA-processing protein FCF1